MAMAIVPIKAKTVIASLRAHSREEFEHGLD